MELSGASGTRLPPDRLRTSILDDPDDVSQLWEVPLVARLERAVRSVAGARVTASAGAGRDQARSLARRGACRRVARCDSERAAGDDATALLFERAGTSLEQSVAMDNHGARRVRPVPGAPRVRDPPRRSDVRTRPDGAGLRHRVCDGAAALFGRDSFGG
jgi:hypothetical protein